MLLRLDLLRVTIVVLSLTIRPIHFYSSVVGALQPPQGWETLALEIVFLVVSCDLIPIMWVMFLVHTSILANKQKSYTFLPPLHF